MITDDDFADIPQHVIDQAAAEISQQEAECLRCATPAACAVWGCIPGTFPPEQPRDTNIQRVPVAYRIRTIDGKGGYSGWRYFTGRYDAPPGMHVELLYNEDGSGCKYPMCSCSVNLHTMGGCGADHRAAEQELFAPKPSIGTAEPVAWRDPMNADPAQGCTYEKAKHDKWPHVYRQPLYAGAAERITPLTDEQWKEKLGDRQLFTIKEAIRFVEKQYGIGV